MGSVNHSYQKQLLAVVIQRGLCLCYGISQSLIPKAVVGSGDSKRTLPLLWDQSITHTKSSGWQWWFKENSASVMGSVNHSYQKQWLAVVVQRGLCLSYGISQSLIPKAVVGSGDPKRNQMGRDLFVGAVGFWVASFSSFISCTLYSGVVLIS